MKPLALWSKTKSQNLELFIPPPAQRNFSLVFPTKWGGLRGRGRRKRGGRKKIKTTRWKRRSSGPAEGSSSCDFLGIALDSGFVYSAGLVKTIYRCEDFEKSANAKARKRGVFGGRGGRDPAGTRATLLNDIYPHKQKSVPARMRDLACVWPRSSGLHRAGLPDVSYYPAALT